MTRLWTAGSPILMECNTDGQPIAFTWNGVSHAVDGILNTWRADVGWWRFRIWREHYKLTTNTGLLVIVFHDLSSDSWYVQRLYD